MEEEFIGVSIEDSVVSYVVGILLLLVLLEALFGRQFSWWKFSSFCLPFFLFFLVDC